MSMGTGIRQLSLSRAVAAACAGAIAALAIAPAHAGDPEHSVARQWNEANLAAIRLDFARPTIHARNLFHVSVAMWDSWAVYDDVADPWLTDEHATAKDIEAARAETLSYAVYRVLQARYSRSPGAATTLANLEALMVSLGYDPDYTSTIGSSPGARGNRIAVNVLYFGLNDNSNEQIGFGNQYYAPINPPLVVALPGNPDIIDPNRWQPLALDFFVDQGEIFIGPYPPALSPEWGQVTPFALHEDDLTVYHRDGFDYWVYHDPGAPPLHGGAGDAQFKSGFEQVVEYSSLLDPTDGVMIDVSPASIGNSTLGQNDGTGHDLNPITGLPYAPQLVPAGDYYRILAEFWADGPQSETPPGHWFTIVNFVSDQIAEKRIGGTGPIVSDLEWDVKVYLTLGGAMHDVAISAWGIKGWYDYVRPVSAIRYLCDLGQCTNPGGPSFHPGGVNLEPGLIEVVTSATTMPGERHEHLLGHEGKIAMNAWRGPDYIVDPETDFAGVGWILAENWWPYQRPTFVSPPFPGYISGHSTFSRCAAETLSLLTGSPWFPGGMGEFPCPQNEFLVFEQGPSVTVTLQWAKYSDASDQCSLSRIYGGIHPTQDDLPGRIIGAAMAPDNFGEAKLYFGGRISCPTDLTADGEIGVDDLIMVILGWGTDDQSADANLDGIVDVTDLVQVITQWGECS